MNVAFIGVFTAQTVVVLLGVACLMLATALLALVAAEAVEAQRATAVRLQPAPIAPYRRDLPMGSSIHRQRPAPSRAPPTFLLRQSWIISRDDSLE